MNLVSRRIGLAIAAVAATIIASLVLGRIVVTVVVLLGFMGLGIAHVFVPDGFMRHSGVRKGGEMLTAWNRLGFRLAGAVIAAVAGYILYDLLSDYVTH